MSLRCMESPTHTKERERVCVGIQPGVQPQPVTTKANILPSLPPLPHTHTPSIRIVVHHTHTHTLQMAHAPHISRQQQQQHGSNTLTVYINDHRTNERTNETQPFDQTIQKNLHPFYFGSRGTRKHTHTGRGGVYSP